MAENLDTYFFNFDLAKEVALRRNTVKLSDSGKGLQICYYNGVPVENGPENLIGVPIDTLFDYFQTTKFRQPGFLCYLGVDITPEKKNEIAQFVEVVFSRVNEVRENREKKYMDLIKNQAPDFDDVPKRVFLMTSRNTTVMQYSTKGIAKALNKLGYEIKLFIEENDMQLLYQDWRVKEIYEFNPHIVVNINHMYNDIINEKIWNIVWWQDPMPELMKEEPLNVRERDIVFSFDKSFDSLWIKKQNTPIYRQDMCMDTDIFHPYTEYKREEKIVFVGQSYYDFFETNDNISSLKNELIGLLENGRMPSEDEFSTLLNKSGVSWWGNYPMASVMQAIIRDTTVQWLCEESEIEVEVYGPGWDLDEIVRPFYKGVIQHGDELANLYRSTKYALVCQGGNIQSQRLVEVAACGAIPVVYDSRPNSTDPLWEEQYLFFRTRKELKTSLKKEPVMREGVFERIKSRFSYDSFAKKIDRMIPKN